MNSKTVFYWSVLARCLLVPITRPMFEQIGLRLSSSLTRPAFRSWTFHIVLRPCTSVLRNKRIFDFIPSVWFLVNECAERSWIMYTIQLQKHYLFFVPYSFDTVIEMTIRRQDGVNNYQRSGRWNRYTVCITEVHHRISFILRVNVFS